MRAINAHAPLRVVMLAEQFAPRPEGGLETQCRRQAETLADRGVDVTVLTRWPGPGVPRRERYGKALIRRVGPFAPLMSLATQAHAALSGKRASNASVTGNGDGSPGPESRARMGLLGHIERVDRLFFILAASLFVRREKDRIDVLHGHDTHWVAGWGAWLASWCGLPFVCKEGIFPPLPPPNPDIPLRSLWTRWRKRAFYIATTHPMADAMRELGVPEDRVVVIPNGVPLPPPCAETRNPREALFVGNLWQVIKALDVLMPAWALVASRHPEARLTMVGGGDAAPWRAMLEAKGCADSVSFVGSVKDVSPYYRRAGLFVLPSRKEGLSNALLESQAHGLAGVVSDIPGSREVVMHGVNGLIVPVGDAEALAEALLELLNDPARCARMGEQARARIEARFSLDRVAQQLVELYRSVLEPNKT